ncbi:MAG: nucleotidyltransferase domain-containing protein [Saprospiraceae bacterium]|uniref:nucleotidyltransferase domain-containing protein n=1 Tax=Candidatus Brachybacter algidus TaxID=2982024 RepID=UPI00257FF2BB|nr:nucleotidyltransferase domain-containing protein [Candidatus Brachybacter algidus]MBK7604388.1 nucleotidyltransferase domain-containing protein [Candidatus Brachybacter algidus]
MGFGNKKGRRSRPFLFQPKTKVLSFRPKGGICQPFFQLNKDKQVISILNDLFITLSILFTTISTAGKLCGLCVVYLCGLCVNQKSFQICFLLQFIGHNLKTFFNSFSKDFVFLTKSFKTEIFKMDSLGETIKKLRKEKELPLRTVAAYLDIDQAILSKIERGKRNANREQVLKLAKFFEIKESDLLVSWLSDKLVYEVANEDVALKALQVAEEKVSYLAKAKTNKATIISALKSIFKTEDRVTSAWLFGSWARGEENLDSDVDIMIEMNSDFKYSMFDILDIAHIIENKINRKVDLVEKGYLKDFAAKTIGNDLIKIYG